MYRVKTVLNIFEIIKSKFLIEVTALECSDTDL